MNLKPSPEGMKNPQRTFFPAVTLGINKSLALTAKPANTPYLSVFNINGEFSVTNLLYFQDGGTF